MRSEMDFVETAGIVDDNVEGLGVLSDTWVTGASFDAQPAPFHTRTCHALRSRIRNKLVTIPIRYGDSASA